MPISLVNRHNSNISDNSSNYINAEDTLQQAFLSLTNVSIRFGGVDVLSSVSFDLARGDIGCLLGPSGCGKTTLLRAIAGFESVFSGSIRLNGNVLSDTNSVVAAEKRAIGMVFQDYALFPHLSVLKNVLFGLHGLSKNEAKSRASQLISQVGLVNKERSMPHELSGGEQQRVALARALAPAPTLLLLDEPFSNLDVELRESLSRDVREIIKQSNTTALMVTHDQLEAFAMADQLGVLHHQHLQQWASALDVYHQPGTQFVASFIGQGTFINGVMESVGQVNTMLGKFERNLKGVYTAVTSGDVVSVLLRPDDIICDSQSGIEAAVKSKYFRGATFLYTLELSNGEQLLALLPSQHDYAIDEKIKIRPKNSSVVVFKK